MLLFKTLLVVLHSQRELGSVKQLKDEAVAETEVLSSVIQELTEQLEDASKLVSWGGVERNRGLVAKGQRAKAERVCRLVHSFGIWKTLLAEDVLEEVAEMLCAGKREPLGRHTSSVSRARTCVCQNAEATEKLLGSFRREQRCAWFPVSYGLP